MTNVLLFERKRKMIVTLITIAVLLFGISCHFCEDRTRWYAWQDICSVLSVLCTSFAGILLVLELVAIVVPHANAIGDQAAMEARRETIIYQLENKTFKNDNNLGTTEVLSAIADYNGDVLKMRAGRKNPWISWFYAPYGEDLELIDLENYK